MPLVYRTVTPLKLSSKQLELQGKYDSEYIAVNNGTLVNILRQLASLVNHATDIFSEAATLTDQVGRRVRSVKLRLDELEAKSELFDPKLVPVPEGSLDDISISTRFSRREVVLDMTFFTETTRPRFLCHLFENAGSHLPKFPPRSPIPTLTRKSIERLKSSETRRPASFAALRDWKLDDYLDEKIATLDKKKQSAEQLSRALASPFPSQLVQVDVTGRGFDRMKRSRRSLVIHTKKIRNKKRRNTICSMPTMPNKECGIQTSFSSVNSPKEDNKKYGIDSGHWSSCTSSAQGGNGAPSTSSAPSPWDPTSLSTSSDFLFDDEDRCLTPQLENFTDGLVSDSDSVDTDGYFTSFRSDCGFPKSKKSLPDVKEDGKDSLSLVPNGNSTTTLENEYELFGKGSTSTTASSCGTVVLRSKPNPPARTSSAEHLIDKKSQSDDVEWEERVKRKSLIERVPSLVVVTPSPSCSSESPPPLKDPVLALDTEDSDKDSGRITPKAEDFLTTGSECGTVSDTDSELRVELGNLTDGRPSSTSSSTSTINSENSTSTLTSCKTSTKLPQPDVIADVQQLQIIRTKGTPKLDVSREYCSLDTVLLGSSFEEERRHLQNNVNGEVKTNDIAFSTDGRVQSPQGSSTSGKIRGARVVLDANGEIIFASETLRRKRKPKVSFDPGSAVKTLDYDNCSNYARIRESVYDRIRKDSVDNAQSEKLYECIEAIRKTNLRDPYLEEPKLCGTIHSENSSASPADDSRSSSSSSNCTSSSKTSSLASRYASRPPMTPPKDGAKVNMLLETDLDSAIPPCMSDLKNLPKIKDRLKRNESYRIANTDNIPPLTRPTLQPLNPNNKTSRRMSFSNKDSSPNGNLHLNKKRDILEEDPAFIQQILNMSTTSAKSPTNSFSSRISLSKLALSPDDRPSFLRRESPPTMDEIAKETYRFRKKFNIQPNATSRILRSPTNAKNSQMDVNQNMKDTSPSSVITNHRDSSWLHRNANTNSFESKTLSPSSSVNRSSPPSASTIPIGFPKLMVKFSTPLSSSTPLRRSASMTRNPVAFANSPVYARPNSALSNGNGSHNLNMASEYNNVNNFAMGNSYGISQKSNPPPPPVRNLSSSGRRPFSTTTGALNTSDYINRNNTREISNSYLSSYKRNSMSLAEPSPGSMNLGARTSLSDFKKLLQAAQRKKCSVSAMEVLKPKIGLETTL